MPIAVVRPGQTYGIAKHPEGTLLDVSQAELDASPARLAPADEQLEEPASPYEIGNEAYVATMMKGATVPAVRQMVTTGKLSAQEALAYETSPDGKYRSSLVSWLNERV